MYIFSRINIAVKKSYIISYKPATCGSFLSALIYSWVNDIDLSDYVFPESGDAHDLYRTYISKSDNPVIKTTHRPSTLSLTDNDLHFYIHHTVNDLSLMAFLYMYKTALAEHNQPGGNLVGEHPRLFPISKDPRGLKSLAMLQLIKDSPSFKEPIEKFMSINWSDKDDMNDIFFSPSQMDRTLNIAFSDLINNPDVVLNDLAKHLQIDMPSHIPLFYKNYLKINQGLIDKYLPESKLS